VKPPGMFSNLRGDGAAALNIAIVSVPSAIGVGLVATLSLGAGYSALGALAGLLGLIAATLFAPFSGASRFQFNAPGPAAAGILSGLGGTVMVMPEIVAQVGGDVDQLAAIALNAIFLCTLLVGVLHILIGQLRLGNLIKLVPQTVITGIMNGIIILVAFYQLPWLLGLAAGVSITDVGRLPTAINYLDLAIGMSAVAGIYAGKRWFKRMPALLAGMLTGTVVYWSVYQLGDVKLGATVGMLPSGLPTPARALELVSLTFSENLLLLGPQILVAAIAISLVTAIGGLVTAAAADALTNNRHNPVGELTGLGVGNIVAAVFSGIPSGGSPTNVMLNYQSGGRTRMSHVLTSVILLACVLGLGPVIAIIPLSVIAGALIVMAIQTFDQWPLQLAKKVLVVESGDLRRNVCFNLALIVVVMVLIIVTDLTTAMLAGLVLELLHFLLKSGKALVRQAIKGSLLHSNVVRDQRASSLLSERGDAIQVVTLQGSLFFGNTDYLASYLEDIPTTVVVVLLDFKRISDIDSSGVLVLARIDRRLSQQNKYLLFTSLAADSDMRGLLEEYGLAAPGLEGRVFGDFNAGLAEAENIMLKQWGYDPDPAVEMPLADTVLFKAFSADELARLALTRVEYDAGAVIIEEGDEADGLYVLVQGRVNISKKELLNDHLVALVEFGPGVNLGEMAILGGGRRSAYVVAKTPSVLYFMSRQIFAAICRDQPVIAVKVLTNISGSLSRRLAETSRSLAELQSY